MKYLIAIGALVILIGTPLTVIALGKSSKLCTATGCDNARIAAKHKADKQRGAQRRAALTGR